MKKNDQERTFEEMAFEFTFNSTSNVISLKEWLEENECGGTVPSSNWEPKKCYS